jgi:hypothetical protein
MMMVATSSSAKWSAWNVAVTASTAAIMHTAAMRSCSLID